MDKRGLTHDPMVDPLASPRWFETVGPTQRPSPYATASWVCVQTYDEILQEVPDSGVEPIVLDNWRDFAVWLYPDVYDGGTFAQLDLPHEDLNGGIYTSAGSGSTARYIKHTFATVKVYDSKASHPGPYQDLDVALGFLSIDSDGLPALIEEIVDPNTLAIYDNGDRMQVPIPNPLEIYDSGDFSQWGLGIVLDGAEFCIKNGEQEIINKVETIFEDGANLQTEGSPTPDLLIEVTKVATSKDDIPPGKLLGEINYEMAECDVVITDWSHYNWMDDLPVRKAFKCLVNSLPADVKNVYVKDSPHAFWTSLGFEQVEKGDRVLVYNDPLKAVPY
jgi:hypothetical protein